MNNDYLWDRTGSDAEIERLESMLEGLRFRPEGPPVAPAREILLEPARPRWFMRLGLGFASASMAAAALLFAIFPLAKAPVLVAVVDDGPKLAQPITNPAPLPGLEYVKASSTPRRPKKRVPRKRVRREARFAPPPEPRRPLPETLTAEERDAFRQLMTALAVAGEQLSIVRHKLNGTGEE